MSSAYFKRGAAAIYPIFMVDSASRPTGKTGASPSVQVSKDGGAFAGIAGSVTEIGSGFYKVTLAAADTDARAIAIKATASGADPWNDIFLTDTRLVSEVNTDGGLVALGGGDQVWTPEQRDKVLKRTERILELVKALPAQMGEAVDAADVHARTREAAIVRTVESLQADARALVRDGISEIKTLLENLPGPLREASTASELLVRNRLLEIEARVLSKANDILRETKAANDGLVKVKAVSDYVGRALTAMMPTETVEQLAGAEQT